MALSAHILENIVLSETKVVSSVATLEECGVLCNINRGDCNTFIYDENSKNCHLIEVKFIWINSHLHDAPLQIDCKIILSSEDKSVAYMRNNMISRE